MRGGGLESMIGWARDICARRPIGAPGTLDLPGPHFLLTSDREISF
jgi:hypothetical protein